MCSENTCFIYFIMLILQRVQKPSLCNFFYQRREGNLERIKTATLEHKMAEYNHIKKRMKERPVV
jgi:hypothetical protein